MRPAYACMSLYAHDRLPHILQPPGHHSVRDIVLSSHARGDNAPAVPTLCASSRQRRLCRVRLVLRRQGLRIGVLCTPRLPPRLSLFSFPSLSRDHHWLFLENLLCPAVRYQRPPPIAPEVSSVPTVERRFNPSHRFEAAHTLILLVFFLKKTIESQKRWIRCVILRKKRKKGSHFRHFHE